MDLNFQRRFPRALYFVSECGEDSSSSPASFSVFHRPDFLSGHFGKVALFDGSDYFTDLGGRSSDFPPSLVPRVQTDFFGGELRGVAFEFFPYSRPDFDDQSRHSGFEFSIADTAARSLGLDLVLRPPSKGARWGRMDENGTFDGRFDGS